MSPLRFEVEVSGLRKPEFIAAIARAVAAPSGFGGNWDALADVLQDMSWQPIQSYVLVLRGELALGEEDMAIAREILDATADYWRTQGKSFQVMFER